MKKLNESALHICDIILTTTTDKSSKGIRKVTKSDISHALVYVESHSVVDATSDGVHSTNTQRLFWEDECAVHVLRMAQKLDDTQSRRIINYVRGRIGTRYSKVEAARTKLGGSKHPSRRQFCSRLVAQAYASAGLNLVADPDYCTPEQLKNSALLVGVQGAIRSVSNEEREARKGIHDTPQSMRDATNTLLEGARKKGAQIESINDIDLHLQTTPSDDAYFAELYKSSGYLTVWVAERAKNFWQYDPQAMLEAPIPDEVKKQYCEYVLGDNEEGLVRYEVNLAGYTSLSEEFSLETFHLLKSLYEKLLELHLTCRQVAAQWLGRQGQKDISSRDEAVLLTPHTPEWFASLQAWNPQQAAHTRSILQLAGSDAVCSTCGDEPAKDYRLVGPGTLAELFVHYVFAMTAGEFAAKCMQSHGAPYLTNGVSNTVC